MILKYLKPRDWACILACGVLIAAQAWLDLRIPEYMTAVTEAVVSGLPPSEVYDVGVDMLICAFLSICASLSAGFMAAMASVSLCRTLRQLQFDKVGSFTPEDLGHFTIDSLIIRGTNDVSQIQRFFAMALQTIMRTPILTVWALVKISGAQWEWTAVTAGGAVAMAVSMAVIITMSRPYYRRVPRLTDAINRRALEHFTGLRTIRAYNAERFQQEAFEKASDDMMENCIVMWKWSSLLPAVSFGISNLLLVAIYWVGAVLLSSSAPEDQVTLFSQMIVFSSYATLMLGSFVRLAFMIQFSNRAMESMRRIGEVLDHEPSIPDGSFDGDGTDPGTVEFDHVSFKYPGTDRYVLRDVSFKVPRGSSLAVTGPTGSGKSTLVALLLRRYLPTEGEIRVDGVDIREYRRSALNERIGYVPQRSTMLSGTVRENVSYGSTAEARSDDDVRWALRVSMADFVEGLPQGLDSDVLEEGRNLSGGQRQRLAIARAVCKDAGIIVLDDPFSALDYATDKGLREAMASELEGRTKVMVSQRIGSVMDSDRILVLDEGEAVGYGTHAELSEGCDRYRQMLSLQKGASQ
ncbi:MAG: ABC transporter ATP-binding protein [Candidatus Methanomethylophilaceae archaeon]|nr:ABC transporter ATP-binding protein [Candidatus Methanomethylophilaceae archaeon]